MAEVLFREEKMQFVFYPAGNTNEEIIFFDNIFCRVMKRFLDILISLPVILLILSWLTPLLAILIKLDSKGSVFFLQKRNGLYNKPFTCIKFRSMIENEECNSLPVRKDDPRITRTGRFLRAYCLDEFPQFLNVFWGNMTLVGPRPHMISENQKYEKLIANYVFRCKVKPGITGLSQVNDRVCKTLLQKMESRIYWDTFYIKNWSYTLDAKILFQTLIFCLNANNSLSFNGEKLMMEKFS
jgi:putative colanic acid biosynthesis UDP-glucose lipid carrier transferase